MLKRLLLTLSFICALAITGISQTTVQKVHSVNGTPTACTPAHWYLRASTSQAWMGTNTGTCADVSTVAAALLTQVITNGDTTHAPSGDAVFDALALKLTTTSAPYDVAVSYDGVPDASATIRIVVPRAFSSGASWAGSLCSAGTAATAQTDFLLKVNTVTKLTLRFAAAGTTCSLVSPTSVTFAAGDVIEIIAPGTPDATLANIAISLKGSLP